MKARIQTETRKIKEIIPYWRNPRDNRASVPKVAESISNYGYNTPIVVDADGVIIKGHTVHRALMRLGWEEADVVVASDMDERRAKEYRIADNKTSEISEWDYDKLYEELGVIDDPAFVESWFPETQMPDTEPDFGGAIPRDQGSGDQGSGDQGSGDQGGDQGAVPGDSPGWGGSDNLDLICPHCGVEFVIAKKDLDEDYEE